MAAPAPSRLARPWVIWAGVALLAAGLYLHTVRGTFVWDDRWFSEMDPRMRDPRGWRSYWTQGYWIDAVDNLWRPLTSLTFWAQYRWTGAAPWAMHLVNVLLHAAASALVAEAARRIAMWHGLPAREVKNGHGPPFREFSSRTRAAIAGWVAGVLFAAHPVHVETVAYLVGRAETLGAIGTLGAVVLMARARGGALSAARALAVYACCVVALLSKEQGLFAPVVVALVAWLRPRPEHESRPPPPSSLILHPSSFTPPPSSFIPRPSSFSRGALLLGMLLLWTWAAYILYRDRILPWFWDPAFLNWTINPLVRSTGWDRWLWPVALAGRAAGLLLFPIKLSPDYGAAVTMPSLSQTQATPWLAAGAVVVAAFAAAVGHAWRARRRSPGVLFCLLALAVAWFPASNLFRIGTVFGERLLYLPSAFALMLAGLAAAHHWHGGGETDGGAAPPRRTRSGKRRAGLLVALLAILVLYGIRTVTYAQRWVHRERFYTLSLAERPESAQLRMLLVQAHQEQARAARARGDEAAARRALQSAATLLDDGRRILPGYVGMWTESAETAYELGDNAAARRFVEQASEIEPGDSAVIYWRAVVETGKPPGE